MIEICQLVDYAARPTRDCPDCGEKSRLIDFDDCWVIFWQNCTNPSIVLPKKQKEILR